MHIYAYIHTETETDRQTDRPNNWHRQTGRGTQSHINGAMLCGVMLPPSGTNSYSLSIKNPNAKYGKPL